MRVIDCHNHLLPDIDDGAIDQEMAIAMAKRAADNGTVKIVLTPHHGNGVFKNFREQVKQLTLDYQSVLNKLNIAVELYPGSELHLTPELPREVADNKVLTYADKGRAVLIELPKQSVPVGAVAILEQLIELGVTPVIAHPERNRELMQNPDMFEEWVEWGCKGQLTGMSVDGRFGLPIQQVCDRWITGGYVHIIASDAHRPKGRSPDLSKCCAHVLDRFGQDTTDILFYLNPERLIEGQSLANVPPSENKPGLKSAWKKSFLQRARKILNI